MGIVCGALERVAFAFWVAHVKRRCDDRMCVVSVGFFFFFSCCRTDVEGKRVGLFYLLFLLHPSPLLNIIIKKCGWSRCPGAKVFRMEKAVMMRR